MRGCELLSALVLLSVFAGQTLAEWHRTNFPVPQEDVDKCGRKGKKSWVCDPDEKLSFDEANQLDLEIDRIKEVTRCPCSEHVCVRNKKGYSIGVAIAPKILSDEEMKSYADDMEEYDKEYPPMTRLGHIQLFAYTLLKRWKLGKCDDGIILVYDPENFSLYTVGGKVALRKLKPDLIGDVTNINREAFSEGAFEGIKRILADYRDILLNKYNMPIYSHRPKAAAVVGSDRRGGATSLRAFSSIALLVTALVTGAQFW